MPKVIFKLDRSISKQHLKDLEECLIETDFKT